VDLMLSGNRNKYILQRMEREGLPIGSVGFARGIP
jgi:hypothetical protein